MKKVFKELNTLFGGGTALGFYYLKLETVKVPD